MKGCLQSLLLIGAVGLVCGCGTDGPARYDLSGTVTYQGQPVAGGEVIFTPDAAKGNTGPGSFATIKEGRYATYPGKGVIGGPHSITIIGYKQMPGTVPDDQLQELFPPRQMSVELPLQSGEHALVVPAE
jgi:hypothetical protein